jgi:Nucleoside 2-deoxyribosyltransferase like
MGKAEQWQERIADALSGAGDLIILNPRRDDWDDSWQQRADDPQFSEQVSWELELDMLDAADVVVPLATTAPRATQLKPASSCTAGARSRPRRRASPYG